MNRDGIARRRLLRGVFMGGAVTVGLPLLNCFLDGNGEAMAADRKPLPVRFGTWFWGLGMTPDIFVPKKIGAGYDLPLEMSPLKDIQQHINVFTGFDVIKDDSPNLCHTTGWVTLRCGAAPANRADLKAESVDVLVANKIGGTTRFRALDATATGSNKDTYSFTGANAYNTPEASPVAFYQRLFGADFVDPNGRTFIPNPRTMLRRSALSGVIEQIKDVQQRVGVEDRQRLDQYFTGLRDVERQLEGALQKPEPIEACRIPKAVTEDFGAGEDVELVNKRHKLLTDLMVMALACDQTRVFNMVYSNAFAATVKKGTPLTHHLATHLELIDEKLGYQPESHDFIMHSMTNWAYFVNALASVREGAGTLLDNTLVYAHSDQELAKIHSIRGIPMFTAGRAGGRVKTGMHIAGGEAPGTRLGYTAMKVMGVDISNWGTKSNRVTSEIGEILA